MHRPSVVIPCRRSLRFSDIGTVYDGEAGRGAGDGGGRGVKGYSIDKVRILVFMMVFIV